MITVSDVIGICDSLSDLENLHEITQDGIFRLLEYPDNPAMILLSMDLASREINRVQTKLRSEVDQLRIKNISKCEPIDTPPPQTTC
jgi:hypothetical protein